MPGPDGARPGLPRRLRQAVTERLHFKLAALFFSCVLWLVVSAEEPTEQVVQIVVAPRLDSSLVTNEIVAAIRPLPQAAAHRRDRA